MMIRQETLALLAVLAVALVMRLLPIASDLPYCCSSHDETNYIEIALRFGTGTLQMSSFMHGVLYPLVLFIGYAAHFALGRMMGFFGSATDFFLAYVKDPTPFVLLARAIVVLCSLGMIGLIYAIASRIYNQRVGLVASLFAAFSLLTFQMSFLALADIPAVMLLMLATYLAVLSVERPNERRLYCAAAVVIGFAAACKYHTGFGVVTLYLAAYMKSVNQVQGFKGFVRLAGLGTAFVAAGFCAGVPQLLFDAVHFYQDVFGKLSGAYLSYNPGGKAWLLIFTHHLRNGLGIPLEMASLVGVGLALYHRSRWDLLMLSFPVSFYLLFMHSVGWAYHMLPAVPFLLILAARTLDAVAESLRPRAALSASLALGALVVGPTCLDSVKFVRAMRSPSTTITAKAWIEEHIPSTTTIMVEGYIFAHPTMGPALIENPATLKRDIEFAMKNKGSGRVATLRLAHYDRLYGNAKAYDIQKVLLLDAEAIDREQPAYLVMTSAMDGPVARELAGYFKTGNEDQRRAAVKEDLLRRIAVKEDIRNGYDVLATITPTMAFTEWFPHLADEDYRLIRDWPLLSESLVRGPTITIWARRPPSRTGL